MRCKLPYLVALCILSVLHGLQEQQQLDTRLQGRLQGMMAAKDKLSPQRPIIIHVNIKYSGSIADRYIKDLKKIFSEFKHLDYPTLPRGRDVKLLHIHGAFGEDVLGWTILQYIQSFIDAEIPIYVSIHDYQWLYPENPNPTLNFLQDKMPRYEDLLNTAKLFKAANKIIFPSSFIKSYYMNFEQLNNGSQHNKYKLVPHIDQPLQRGHRIPSITNANVNVAFFGELLPDFGAELYYFLIAKYGNYKYDDNSTYKVNFHLFGKIGTVGKEEVDERIISLPNFVYHPITVENMLLSSMRNSNIHMLMFLSLCPQTYNYGFTNKANLGLPIVYLNQGILMDRLNASSNSNYFRVDKTPELATVFEGAVNFVAKHSGKSSGLPASLPRKNESVSFKWYRDNYPPPDGSKKDQLTY